MDAIRLNENVYVLTGAVNMGVVSTDAGLVAVDTGLDKQAAKRILKAVEELGQPLVAIINTHAHADHFGGNSHLLTKFPDALVCAPVDEAAVIRQPLFEPQYLWQGATPFAALQNKFLLAPGSRVDMEFSGDEVWSIGSTEFAAKSLPGHAHAQCGVWVDGVLFAADSYFGASVTDKHGIPFMVDYQKTLASAAAATEVEAKWWVPGHGQPLQDASADTDYLMARHRTVYEDACQIVRTGAVSLDSLTGRLCDKWGLAPSNAGMWLLVRTTIAAYVSAAIEAGRMEPVIVEGVLNLIAK